VAAMKAFECGQEAGAIDYISNSWICLTKTISAVLRVGMPKEDVESGRLVPDREDMQSVTSGQVVACRFGMSRSIVKACQH
jgi:hypothetical protein